MVDAALATIEPPTLPGRVMGDALLETDPPYRGLGTSRREIQEINTAVAARFERINRIEKKRKERDAKKAAKLMAAAAADKAVRRG